MILSIWVKNRKKRSRPNNETVTIKEDVDEEVSRFSFINFVSHESVVVRVLLLFDTVYNNSLPDGLHISFFDDLIQVSSYSSTR